MSQQANFNDFRSLFQLLETRPGPVSKKYIILVHTIW